MFTTYRPHYAAVLALCLYFSPATPCALMADGPTKTFPPVADNLIKRYTAYRVASPVQIDGALTEDAWRKAPKSPAFVDLVSGRETIHDTRAAVLWNDTHLFVAYWVEEPFVTAKLKKRDAPVYRDNDVELFIAGKHAYYEFEINAWGTIYEGLFVWQDAYEREGFAKIPELNRKRPNIRSQRFNGVGLKNHPRGLRWAFLDWDFPKLHAAVMVNGTINHDHDRDRGWTVELAIPWAGMKSILQGDPRAVPPKPGDVWRIDFSRFNQYKEAPPAKDSGGWAWSHHGVWDSHVPEVFPKITFRKDLVSKVNSDTE